MIVLTKMLNWEKNLVYLKDNYPAAFDNPEDQVEVFKVRHGSSYEKSLKIIDKRLKRQNVKWLISDLRNFYFEPNEISQFGNVI